MKGDVVIPSRTSPKGSKRGCLCKDKNTYSRKCCDGSLRAQGIGSFTNQGTSVIFRGEKWQNIISEWDDINKAWENV